jgi:hypothetical protein
MPASEATNPNRLISLNPLRVASPMMETKQG